MGSVSDPAAASTSPAEQRPHDDSGRARQKITSRFSADPDFRQSVLVWFAIFFVGSMMLAGAGVYIVQDREESRRLAQVKSEESGIVFAQMGAIRERLKLVRSDLMFLRNEVEYLLNTPGETLQSTSTTAGSVFKNFAKSREIYDQIRIILPSGQEYLRVNYNGGSPIIAAETRLQDKSERTYVQAPLAMSHGQIYVSPLDLNVEDGRVVRPYKPTVRISTPLETADGDRVGVIVLNYLASSMLTAVESAADLSSGDPMMLNAAGYWFVSRTPPPAWGFMFDDEHDERMNILYPQTWAAAQTATSGQILTDEGLFSYSVVDPVSDIMTGVQDFEGFVPPRAAAGSSSNPRRWYVGTFLDADQLDAEVGEPSRAKLFYVGLVLSLCFLGSTAAAFALAEARHYRLMLERLARFDSLTGLANRRSLEEQLDVEIKRAREHERSVVLAFLDIDGFKKINDDLGHSVGDEALVDIAQTIERKIREYVAFPPRGADEATIAAPVAARMGGDEFVVMFPEAESVEAATTMLKRLGKAIRGLSWKGHGVGVSIGIALYPEHGLTRDALLETADAAMYQAKSAGKNTIVMANSPALASA